MLRLGRIGRYFELKQTQTGKSLATFTLATVEPYRDESGNWAKRTVWRRIVAWDETAVAVGELIQKGARVSVEGSFKTREWTGRENNLQPAHDDRAGGPAGRLPRSRRGIANFCDATPLLQGSGRILCRNSAALLAIHCLCIATRQHSRSDSPLKSTVDG